MVVLYLRDCVVLPGLSLQTTNKIYQAYIFVISLAHGLPNLTLLSQLLQISVDH